MSIKKAIATLTDELKKDEGYRQSWQSNLAVSYLDNEYWYKQKTGKKYLNRDDKHIIANNAADHFLKLLCK